ncbi:MAG: S46 family peptidase [Polyangiaceae bacterium]
MRDRNRMMGAALLALPMALTACPSEPNNGVEPPPQPTASPSASASADAAKPPTPAFESPGGKWMPEQIPLHKETLTKLGIQIEPEKLADFSSAPMGAVVSLGGCTGSFVSGDGLIVTNHHCVNSYLGFASSKEHDYQTDGVHAKTRESEVWAGPAARVFITQSFRDVTADVRAGLEAIKDDVARLREEEKHIKSLVAGCEKDRPGIRCNIASFFGGAQYRLIEQAEMTDVRLVYAPPAGVGDYGGEVDNWRWPRHGGDFSFIRVYVGKDGKPAAHAADNVPYKPRFHLSFPTSPLRAGDLAFVAGYPAITFRLKLASEVEEVATFTYPGRIDSYAAFLGVLESFAAKDAELKRRTSNQVQGLNNALTKMRGVVEGLTSGDHLAQRKKSDADLQAFIDADPTRKSAWGPAIEAMNARLAEQRKLRVHDAAVRELLFMPRLLGQAMIAVRLAEERQKPDADRHPTYQQRNEARLVDRTATFQAYYDADVEKAVLTLALDRTAKLDPKDWPAFATPLLKLKKADRDKKVAALYDKTKLGDLEARKKLFLTAKTADLKKLKDPLMDLALAARPTQKSVEDREEALDGAFLLLSPKYAEASRAFAKASGKPDIAPDANGTLRISFGTVRGYRPRPDAPVYTPFTTLAELVKKHTGKEPFDAPKAELDAFAQGKKGPYLFADIGDVPVDFLTDLDITGGNSGSPTLNAKGELIGLAFDGNYEGVASDWMFLPETTRSIHVDARYILWILDAVAGAKELLTELGQTPTFAK